MIKHQIALGLMLCLLVAGCEKKLEPVPVGEMNEYRDPGYGFRIKYPKEWKQLGTTGKAVFAKAQDIVDKFQNPATGIEGAMVTAQVIRYEGKSAEGFIQAASEDLKQAWQNIQIGPGEKLAVSNKEATKIPYMIPVTSKTNITGYEIYIPGDTAMYKLEFFGYGDQYTAHAAIFEAMLKSYELPVVVAKKPDIWQASATLETFATSPYFTMQYPDNLEFVQASKGKFDYAMEMRADRLDCGIRIDVFGAKELSVEKVWEQNKGKYKARATGETTIDGDKGFWVDYSLRKDIGSRAYFVVRNDKVIRVTLNWYAPKKDVYLPVFEKCVSSLKLK